MKDQNKSTNACSTCGGRMALRGYEHVEKVGKYKVKDATAPALQCAKCDDVELTLEQLAGYQRRAAAVALREAPEIDGPMVKYARRALGMKQVELAEHIGCAPETLSRYETGTQIPRQVKLAIVAVLDGVEQAGGLETYLEQGPDRPSEKTLEVLPLRRACV